MSDRLHYQIEQDELILSGALIRANLLPLWQQNSVILSNVTGLNTAALTHIDSAGLALLLQFIADAAKHGKTLMMSGIVPKLATLIKLYNLQDVLADNLADNKPF